jgi:hypothetical protein
MARGLELQMARTIGKFDFDVSSHGVRFTSASLGLSPGCQSEKEIDGQLELLKADLDAVAARMKAALRKRACLETLSGQRLVG